MSEATRGMLIVSEWRSTAIRRQWLRAGVADQTLWSPYLPEIFL